MPKKNTPEQIAAIALLQTQVQADAPPGYSAETTGKDRNSSKWVKRLGKWSKELDANALAYYNLHAHRKIGAFTTLKDRRKPKRVLSSEGFPSNVTVSYAYPPPFSFRTEVGIRNIRHIVIHSMGHGWHAGRDEHNPSGWFNRKTRGRGTKEFWDVYKFVYIPKGTESPVTMSHYRRFSNGLRFLLRSASLSTANFFIDRNGNLVVVGDVNDIMYTSVAMNKSSVGIEMEEAYFCEDDPLDGGEPATFKYGGSPTGTNGSIKPWPFTRKQLITLSIVLRKMETMYPSIKLRRRSYQEGADTPANPPGYTIHNWIRPPNHLDTNPHFINVSEWKKLFKLVDSQDQITPHNCFRPATYSGIPPTNIELLQPLAAEVMSPATERLYNAARETGLAQDRASMLVNVTRGAINSFAGKAATSVAGLISRYAATLMNTAQKTESPMMELPNQSTQVGADGFFPGNDDMWSY